jgi:hypothetical protein
MQRRIIWRGLLAGAVGGLLAFLFARVFAEPQIQRAIDYEGGRDHAQEALNSAAGITPHEHGEVFSRAVQATVGVGVGMVLFGVAMGALFAVAYAICLGRTGRLRPRTLSLLVAGGGFLAIYLVPFGRLIFRHHMGRLDAGCDAEARVSGPLDVAVPQGRGHIRSRSHRTDRQEKPAGYKPCARTKTLYFLLFATRCCRQLYSHFT